MCLSSEETKDEHYGHCQGLPRKVTDGSDQEVINASMPGHLFLTPAVSQPLPQEDSLGPATGAKEFPLTVGGTPGQKIYRAVQENMPPSSKPKAQML